MLTLSAVVVIGCRQDEPAAAACSEPRPALPAATAAELCESCDGAGLCVSAPMLLTSAYRMYPLSLAWTGKEFGVVWNAMPDLRTGPGAYFANVSGEHGIGCPVQLSTGRGEAESSIAFNGTRFGVFWTRAPADSPPPNPDQVVAVVEPDGQLVAPNDRSLAIGGPGKLVWNDDANEYAVAWTNGRDVLLTRASPTGRRLLPDLLIGQAKEQTVGFASTGSVYAVAWPMGAPSDPGGESIVVTEVQASTNAEPAMLALGGGPSRSNPRTIDVHQLLWTGTDYALLWTETNDQHVSALYLARVTPGNAEVTSAVLVSELPGNHWLPSLALSRDRFVVAWPQWEHPEGVVADHQQVFLAAYSQDLELVAGPLQVSQASEECIGTGATWPVLTAGPDGLLLLAWHSGGEPSIACPANETRHFGVLAQVAVCG